jgi:hypothetical protein
MAGDEFEEHPAPRVIGNTTHDTLLATMIERVDAMRRDQARADHIQTRTIETLDRMRDTVTGLDNTMKMVNERLDRQDRLAETIEELQGRLREMEIILDPSTFKTRYARFEKVETLVLKWDGWLGTGWAFVGKLLLVFAGSGAIGAWVSKFFK